MKNFHQNIIPLKIKPDTYQKIQPFANQGSACVTRYLDKGDTDKLRQNLRYLAIESRLCPGADVTTFLACVIKVKHSERTG